MISISTLKILVRLMAAFVALAGGVLLMLFLVVMTSSEAWSGAAYVRTPLFLSLSVVYLVLGAGLIYTGLKVWFRWSEPAVRFMMSWLSLILFIGLGMPLWGAIREHLSDFWRVASFFLIVTAFFALFRWGTECLCKRLFPDTDGLAREATASS